MNINYKLLVKSIRDKHFSMFYGLFNNLLKRGVSISYTPTHVNFTLSFELDDESDYEFLEESLKLVLALEELKTKTNNHK